MSGPLHYGGFQGRIWTEQMSLPDHGVCLGHGRGEGRSACPLDRSSLTLSGIFSFSSLLGTTLSSSLSLFFFSLFLIGYATLHTGSLAPGDKPVPPAVEVWSLNQWTTRKVPILTPFYPIFFSRTINLLLPQRKHYITFIHGKPTSFAINR